MSKVENQIDSGFCMCKTCRVKIHEYNKLLISEIDKLLESNAIPFECDMLNEFSINRSLEKIVIEINNSVFDIEMKRFLAQNKK